MLAAPMLIMALKRPLAAGFAFCIMTAFLSDVFDGIVARRMGIATSFLRRLDSIADTVFCASAVAAIWLLYPGTIRDHLALMLILVGLELLRYVFDFAKFHREASYHMWSSKLWGLALYAAFFSVLVLACSGATVYAALWIGIAADLEGLAISFVLPTWHHDVPTLFHAWRIRGTFRPARLSK